jgi:kynureninase
VNVSATPADTLSDRLAASLDSRTGCVMASSVLFETAAIVPGLERLAAACRRDGVPLLLDAYHQLNVVPFDLGPGLEDVFVTGGGYKYCQLGEGNCFLRVPPQCQMRPVLTAGSPHSSHVSRLVIDACCTGRAHGRSAVRHTTRPHITARPPYSMSSSNRILTADTLGVINRHQVQLLKIEFERLDCAPSVGCVEPMPDERRGGFWRYATAAIAVARHLRERGVHSDARGEVLRLGPAPYLRDDQLRDAIHALGDILRHTAESGQNGDTVKNGR